MMSRLKYYFIFTLLVAVHNYFIIGFNRYASRVKSYSTISSSQFTATHPQSSSLLDDKNIVIDEYGIRRAIRAERWKDLSVALELLPSSYFKSGRNIVYTITETCRKNGNLAAALPLLRAIPKNIFDCTEDDIMPMLSDAANKNYIIQVQPILSYLQSVGVKFTGRAYSSMLKGIYNFVFVSETKLL